MAWQAILFSGLQDLKSRHGPSFRFDGLCVMNSAKARRGELLSDNYQFWVVRRKKPRKMLAQAITQPFLALMAKWDGVW